MKLTNEQKINLILKDLQRWAYGAETRTDSIYYALDHGYRLHAASLWMSTGAMSEEIEAQVQGVKINRKKELQEIHDLCASAGIFICRDCNAHHFVEKDSDDSELMIDKPFCSCCHSSNVSREVKRDLKAV